MTNRCIYFAGYAYGGSPSQIDFELIAELSRFGDVYAWYDNDDLKPEALARLQNLCAGVHAERHGEYDFGSYKRLYMHYKFLTESYDEFIFTNDSAFPVKTFDALFASRDKDPSPFWCPLLIDQDYTGLDILIDDYFMHLDRFNRNVMYLSSFWCLSKSLYKRAFVRNFFESIKKENTRLAVSENYERGFSRLLWKHGVPCGTFFNRVFLYSCIYNFNATLLVSEGLPFLKKKAVTCEFYLNAHISSQLQSIIRQSDPKFTNLLVEEFK